MVFISRLKLRNFKSFKAADITLPKTFICFAGPNGSGKSNLCDAIRFAMGEKSLRSLRAKTVRDLIHSGARSAEVTLVFESENGGPRYEIRRAIREDGKIRYRLDEKKTTRGAILESLKRHNLDESGRNTIAQGEVQRVIGMNGKERRGIIDSVAGIADFEEKKKEALGELATVEERIKEGRLVLGERKAFLDELEREKEVALKYIESKKTLTNAKGTLLRGEVERLEKDLAESNASEERILAGKKGRDADMAVIEEEISKVDNQRSKASEEMQAKQKTNALIRRLEELKASCGSKKQLIEDKEAFIKDVRNDLLALRGEAEKDRAAIDNIEKEIATMRGELRKATEALESAGGMAEDDAITAVRKALEGTEKELAGYKEKLAFARSEIEAKRGLIEAKREEERAIAPKGLEEDEKEDMNALKREAERIGKDIDRSFSKTKDINAQMGELDRQMLETKEKASIFKVRSSPQLANPALSFVAELMKERDSGIYGTVADLITFDSRHGNAVEAAGGARLLYVVVDSMDTATGVIGKLKAAKAGRATFIPLDTIRTPPQAKAGAYSSVMNIVQSKDEVRRAVEYVFADTLLVDTVAEARKLGIGSGRMVTLEGEIFERSGIVSGGRSQGSMLNNNQLRKIESELNEMKATKDSLVAELYSIREEESRMRAEKSQIEIRIKTIEMKERMDQERRSEIDALLKRKEQLSSEISALERSVEERSAEAERLSDDARESEGRVAQIRGRLRAAEEEYRRMSEKTSAKRAELSAAVSSIRATIEGRLSELDLRRNECSTKDERLRKLSKDEKEALDRINEARKQAGDDEVELKQVEERISSASKEIEKLFEQMKAYEDRLQDLGKRRGTIRIELDKFTRDLNQLGIKKATTGTRLEDIRAELAAYPNAEFLDLPRDELAKMVASAETALATLGNVNMAAIEMFDKRKAEIDEVETKIGKLDHEREAILSMISEIDEHKKDAFFGAFNAISENFGNMFKYVNVGQGHLYLSDPANPFESGLFIKLRRNNQEHSLDALSGGEKTLVALMFIFALQLFKPAPFYILDEVDAALDKANSKNLADLVQRMSNDSQFIVVSHNDTVMSNSDSVIGVTKADGMSKLVGIKLKQLVTS
ncbi:MAG: AAA family ATPase [Candidatus Micrarchaeia archaeon]